MRREHRSIDMGLSLLHQEKFHLNFIFIHTQIGLLRTANYCMTVATVNYLNTQQRSAFIIHTFKGHSQLWGHANLDTSFLTLKKVRPNLK